VLAAIVEAEKIEPTDEELVQALRPAAERDGSDPVELLEQLRKAGRLEGLREDVASRQAVELLVREAEAISVDQAGTAGEAGGPREKLWTPGREEPEGGGGQIWTPGS
jgi:FKBP-type peptidyl-prolyl cis-trans isomerase (trigger factor)